jgi:molybdopterin biosynthesis enzyme
LDWTQFIHGRLSQVDQCLRFQPLKNHSRLQTMAQTEAIAKIREGSETLPANEVVMVQVLGKSQLLTE